MEAPTKEQLLASEAFYSISPAEQTVLLGKVDPEFAKFDVAQQRRAVEGLNAARKSPVTAAPESPRNSYWQNVQDAASQGYQNIQSGTNKKGIGGRDVVAPDPFTPLLGINQILLSPITGGIKTLANKASDAMAGKNVPGPINDFLAGAVDATGNLIAGAGIGKAGQYGRAAEQAVARRLPGASVGMREAGKREVGAMASSFAPEVPSDILYKQVQARGVKVSLPEFHDLTKKVAREESELQQFGLANRSTESVAAKSDAATAETKTAPAKFIGDEFEQDIVTGLKDIPFSVVQKIRQRLGERISESRAAGGEGLGQYKQMFKTLSQDLDNAAEAGVGPAFQKLKEANAAAKREFALGELDDIYNASFGRAREGANYTSSNFAQAKNKIADLRRESDLFEQGIGTKNLDKLEGRLAELAKLKVNPPPKGVNAGSLIAGRQMGIGGSIGAGVGYAVGGPSGATYGGAAGTALGAGLPWIISRMLESDKGSKMLMNFLESPSGITPAKMATMMAFVRGASGFNAPPIDERTR